MSSSGAKGLKKLQWVTVRYTGKEASVTIRRAESGVDTEG